MKTRNFVAYSQVKGLDMNVLYSECSKNRNIKLKRKFTNVEDSAKVLYLDHPDKMEKLINLLHELDIVHGDYYNHHSGVYLGVYFEADLDLKKHSELKYLLK
ncbi:hypothetical protein POP12_042 [Pectobacterium phage POP12]|nr:hypothetical protein POP12_042 [Pectobacterium phage POP12]